MVRGERIPSKATLSSPFLLEGVRGRLRGLVVPSYQRSLVFRSFVPFDDAKVGNKKLACRHIRQHVSFTSNLRQNRVSYVSFTSESTVLGYPNIHRTTHPKDYYPYHNMVQTCLHNPDSGQSY